MENTSAYCGLAASANIDYLSSTSARYTGSLIANTVNYVNVYRAPSKMAAIDDNYGEGSSSGPGTAYNSQDMGLAATMYYHTLSSQNPLFKSKTARRVTINGQTGMFFEYHFPHIVVPTIQESCNQNTEVSMNQSSRSKVITDLTPRECVFDCSPGKFFPDYFQQSPIMPYSSIRATAVQKHPDALQEQTLTNSHPASTVATCIDSFNVDNDPGIRIDSEDEEIASEVIDTSDEGIVSRLGRLVLDDNSNSRRNSKDRPKRVSTPKSEDSEPSVEAENTTVDDDTVDLGVHRLDLVIKRWQGSSRLRRKEKCTTFSHKITIPNVETNLIFNYRHPTWSNLKSFFEKHCDFQPKTDMVFIDDYGANRANYFDQLLEDRIEAMIRGGLGVVSNAKDVNWVYKIGIIIVDLTSTTAFQSFMKEQNPYHGMGVRYERKSPKDCHLLPPWIGSFRDLHLDHDRTFIGLKNGIRPSDVTPNMMAEFRRSQPEQTINFQPPKNWCGEEPAGDDPEPTSSQKNKVQITAITQYVNDRRTSVFIDDPSRKTISLDSPLDP